MQQQQTKHEERSLGRKKEESIKIAFFFTKKIRGKISEEMKRLTAYNWISQQHSKFTVRPKCTNICLVMNIMMVAIMTKVL